MPPCQELHCEWCSAIGWEGLALKTGRAGCQDARRWHQISTKVLKDQHQHDGVACVAFWTWRHALSLWVKGLWVKGALLSRPAMRARACFPIDQWSTTSAASEWHRTVCGPAGPISSWGPNLELRTQSRAETAHLQLPMPCPMAFIVQTNTCDALQMTQECMDMHVRCQAVTTHSQLPMPFPMAFTFQTNTCHCLSSLHGHSREIIRWVVWTLAHKLGNVIHRSYSWAATILYSTCAQDYTCR